MTVLISALAFLLLLSFLVLIHECGHFFSALYYKVRVEEFGFGLPPRAKTLFKKNGTIFSLNWIPFGGFVRLQGESANSEAERRKAGSFSAAPIRGRIIILVAGVMMNFLFALIIFTMGFAWWQWVPTYLSLDDMKVAAARGEITLTPGIKLSRVQPNGTGAAAALPAPSTITAVDGKEVYFPQDIRDYQAGKARVTYTLRLPNGTMRDVVVSVQDGRTGVELEMLPTVVSAQSRGLIQGFGLSLREAGVTMGQTVIGIAKLFQSLAWKGAVPEGITGIVGIAELTHETVQEGFLAYLRLMAVLSLSLAALNILPFPALDGGRLAFVLMEAVRRRPAPRRFELITNSVGFLVLIVLIVLVTFHDILRFF